MNKLQIFNNNEFGEIRTIVIDEKTYMVATDIARALGYKNTRDAIKRHCKGVVKHDILTKGGNQQTNCIPEGDIYRLVVNSELPGAERFETWVFDEVLPTIRKHGVYMTPEVIEETLTNPDFIIQLATKLKEEQQARIEAEKQNKINRPKVIFADSVSASHTSILVGELAKLLKQNGVNTGQNRLFEWLRNNGYLIRRKGTDYNMPTQYSMDRGLFEIKETAITRSDGRISISKTPKVTGRGQLYFINKLKEEKDINKVGAMS